MNIKHYLTISKSFFNDILGYFKRMFDKDTYKTAVHPDEDWLHIIVMFIASITLFALLSLYFYFNVELRNLEISDVASKPIVVDGEIKKINEAVKLIQASEENLSTVIEKVPEVRDPSM